MSPSTLILGAEQTAYVKVHTDIAFTFVDRSSVALNGIPAAWTKEDDRGDLVAAFVEAEVKAIVAPPQATLTLTGTTLNGVSFVGSDTVRVIVDPSPDE